MKSVDMDCVGEMAAKGFNHEQALKERDLALAPLQKAMEKSDRHTPNMKRRYSRKR
jgi:hypothetical protein